MKRRLVRWFTSVTRLGWTWNKVLSEGRQLLDADLANFMEALAFEDVIALILWLLCRIWVEKYKTVWTNSRSWSLASKWIHCENEMRELRCSGRICASLTPSMMAITRSGCRKRPTGVFELRAKTCNIVGDNRTSCNRLPVISFSICGGNKQSMKSSTGKWRTLQLNTKWFVNFHFLIMWRLWENLSFKSDWRVPFFQVVKCFILINFVSTVEQKKKLSTSFIFPLLWQGKEIVWFPLKFRKKHLACKKRMSVLDSTFTKQYFFLSQQKMLS